jgi:predicted membrane protein
MVMTDDPVLRRRAQIARLADLGQKVGYALFGVAVVAFVIAAIVGFSPAWVTVIVVAMLVGSVVLAPAIVLGFAAKAADREDREVGR